MNIEKMREEFEAYMHAEEPELMAACKKGGSLSLGIKDRMFLCWIASRAAIEVELPSPRSFYGNSSECIEGYDIDETCEAIESLGLKVKS